MERTTRTNTFESTSARSEQQQENKLSVHDVPTETFAYNSQLLGLNNDSAPAQMKANPEEEQVQLKPEEELQMKPKEEDLQMKPEEEEMQMKREDDENKTQLKKGAVGLETAGGATKTAMPEAVQAKMENSFGTDFSNVTIHKDSGSATQMGAQAYAQGNDVHFAPGKYNPNTQGGQELLGHELTHVVQQRQGRVNGTQNKGGANVNSDPTLENEADVMGAKAAKGQPALVNGKGSGVQKKSIPVKSYESLVVDNLNTRRAIVDNQMVALQNFETIVNSASKKETNEKSAGAIAAETTTKFVLEKIMTTALKKIPVASDIYSLGKSIVQNAEKERKRAQSADQSFKLGQFIVDLRTKLGTLNSKMLSSEEDIRLQASSIWDAAAPKGAADPAKVAVGSEKGELIMKEYMENIDLDSSLSSTHSIPSLFNSISTSWINASSFKGKYGWKEGYVHINADENLNIINAIIVAPKGQQIAEQMLRNNGGTVDLNEWNVKRRLLIRPLLSMEIDISESGSVTSSRYNPFYFGDEKATKVLKKLASKGLGSTKKLIGGKLE